MTIIKAPFSSLCDRRGLNEFAARALQANLAKTWHAIILIFQSLISTPGFVLTGVHFFRVHLIRCYVVGLLLSCVAINPSTARLRPPGVARGPHIPHCV